MTQTKTKWPAGKIIRILSGFLLSMLLVGLVLWSLFRPAAVEVYKVVDGVELHLNIFAPDPAVANGAAVILYHGGAWVNGRPWMFFVEAGRLAAMGFVALVPAYRVYERNGTTAHEALADARSAYQWVLDHADNLAIDPARIALLGSSAGGHLAAAVALVPGDRPLSPGPALLVLRSPVTDTSRAAFLHAPSLHDLVMGDRALDISPIHHVGERPAPPVLIFHGETDPVVPVAQSRRFCQRLRESGNVCELRLIHSNEHGLFLRPGSRQEVVEQTADFLGALLH